jgi:hypothetical protein
MTTRFIRLTVITVLAFSVTSSATAQIASRPTPPPTVTAENEPWYLSGEPVFFNGNIYYAAGPVSHFLRNEMVLAGIYGNSPIYTRTTREPGSIIYVPLAGGLVKPYERRRSGDLAGTSGSTAPSFRVVLPAEEASQTVVGAIRAPAPPTGVPVGTFSVTPMASASIVATAPVPEPGPTPAGTTGAISISPSFPARTRVETVQRPVGLNNVFIQFDGARWFAAGPAVEFSSDRFLVAGEHLGFTVYRERDRSDVVYLSLLPGSPGLVAPYRKR